MRKRRKIKNDLHSFQSKQKKILIVIGCLIYIFFNHNKKKNAICQLLPPSKGTKYFKLNENQTRNLSYDIDGFIF